MVNALNPANAFSVGCDLWVVAQPSLSRWAGQMDWYLNFAICKSLKRQPPRMSEELLKILTHCEVEAPPVPVSESPAILIESSRDLPAKRLLVLPYENDLKAWTEGSLKIWNRLGCPKLRIFMPDGVDPKTLAETWERKAARASLSIVA